MIKYTPQEYLLLLKTKTAHTRRILVEGKSDQIAFENLRYDLNIDTNLLEVDSAERLIEFPRNASGNRAKVEFICSLLDSESGQNSRLGDYEYQKRFIGFVDRELREFEITPSLRDLLERHLVRNRLVWSRGHSIENYFFDLTVLADAFRPFILEQFEVNIKEFQRLFPSVIRLAAILTLLLENSRHFRNYNLVTWQPLELLNDEIQINQQHWRRHLTERRLLPNQVDTIIQDFISFQDLVSSWDYSITRWMIHGHASLHTITHSLARCASDNGCSSTQIESIIRNPNNEKDASCITAWIRQLRNSKGTYPFLVFDLLGIQYSI